MKKIMATGFLVIISCLVFSQRQTKYESRTLVQFGKTTINITNDFITDSGRKFSPSTLQFPFKEEVFNITGPRLILSIASLDTGEYFKGGISGWLRDTIPQHQKLFSLPDLQVKISRNKQVGVQWKDVATFPMSFIDTSVVETKTNKSNYSIIDDTLGVNDNLIIEIRSKEKPDAVFRMRFVRTPLPVMPFLAMMMQDSSATKSEAEFIKNAIETGNKEFKSINSFYKNWPPLYGKGINNQRYFSSSKLAFFFRKPNEYYPDFSLEYALVKDNDNDTIWNQSGHLIIVTKLQTNVHYTMLVRYKKLPENIWTSSFYVAPKWYQTNTFKLVCGVLSAIIVTGFFLFFYFKRRIKKESRDKEKIQMEQKMIRAQLNPHFTFNALSSIQSLMNQNKINEANFYITEFSSLLRHSLHNNEKEMLPLKEDLKTLEQYIKLEQLRFHFNYQINVANGVNTITAEVPALLLQPLVENAIKHGISHLQTKGNIVVDITNENKNMLINIIDNGAGFSTQKETTGYGLALTKQRIRLLNKKYKEQKIQLHINSNAAGTTVILAFNNWL